MAALSSITRTRWASESGSPGIGRLRRCERQRQGESGAPAGTGAFGVQRAAQCLGREGAAVQSETVAVRTGREAVTEDPVEVCLGDADPRIDYGDEHRCRRRADPHGYT